MAAAEDSKRGAKRTIRILNLISKSGPVAFRKHAPGLTGGRDWWSDSNIRTPIAASNLANVGIKDHQNKTIPVEPGFDVRLAIARLAS